MTTKLKLSNSYKEIPIGYVYQIVYKQGDKVIIERIKANSHSDALRIAAQKGEVMNCIYMHSNSDLLYLH